MAENPRWLAVFLKGALPCAPSRLEMVVVYIDPESQGLMHWGKSKRQTMGKMMGFLRTWGTLTMMLRRYLVGTPQAHTLMVATDLVL